MRKIVNNKKGQAVIAAAVAFIVVFILALVIIEAGSVISQKIHAQNIADSAAMEGGIWYARSLNIISASNKVLAAAFAVKIAYGIRGAIMCGFPNPASAGCAVLAMKKEKFTDIVIDAQDMFAGTGGKGEKNEVDGIDAFPFLIAAMVALNGKNNDAAVCPVFNTEKEENLMKKIMSPDFNVKRKYLSDCIGEIAAKLTGKSETETDKHAGGEETKNKIEEEGGFTAVLKKMLGAVAEELNMPLFIEETGGHTVLACCYKESREQISGGKFFKNSEGGEIKPFLFSTSMARVSGGSMKFWDIGGASYSARLDNVEFPALLGGSGFPTGELPGADKISKYSAVLSENIILH